MERKIIYKNTSDNLILDTKISRNKNEQYDTMVHLNNEYDSLLAVPGSFKKLVVINKPLLSYTNKDGITKEACAVNWAVLS